MGGETTLFLTQYDTNVSVCSKGNRLCGIDCNHIRCTSDRQYSCNLFHKILKTTGGYDLILRCKSCRDASGDK